MDSWPPHKRSQVMALVKSQNTKPEVTLRKALFSMGYRYKINDKTLPGKPDIVMPKYRTVIFVHGCFWHSHPNCNAARMPKSNTDYWQPKLFRNVERDESHQEELKIRGWSVIIVWECELKKSLPDLLKKIVQLTISNS